jgi:hypothetical protein
MRLLIVGFGMDIGSGLGMRDEVPLASTYRCFGRRDW